MRYASKLLSSALASAIKLEESHEFQLAFRADEFRVLLLQLHDTNEQPRGGSAMRRSSSMGHVCSEIGGKPASHARTAPIAPVPGARIACRLSR